MLSIEQLTHHVRNALDHLYDPDRLRHSPLAVLLGVEGKLNTPLLLRRIMTNAIESLRPEADVPHHSPVWRAHEVLLYRYVQQFSQREVADQLGLSVRHLRREQEAALEMLATQLWTEFRLGEDAESEVSRREDRVPPSSPQELSPSISDELAWLRDPSLNEPADPSQVLSEVMRLAGSLAAQYGVHLEITAPDSLPNLAIHPAALRQAILSLITVAIRRTPGGRVLMSAKPTQQAMEIRLRAIDLRPGPRAILHDDTASLDMAHRLVSIFGGVLSVPTEESSFTAMLTLPILEQVPVLIVDDNEDTVQLFKRYASATRYHLIGTHDPDEVLTLAKTLSARIIVLDVMMPGVDGWELLGRLRQHPITGQIPIVICTVLAQEELALSLGASSFLHKPVTRQVFLETLDSQVLAQAIVSRR